MPCKSWKQSVSCVVQFSRVCKCEYQQQLTQVTSEFSTPNSFATSVTVNDTVAKSNESHILQPERRTQHQHLDQRATKEPSPRACKFSRGDSPSQETSPKHEPLMRIKLPQDSNGILHLSPRRLEGSHSSGYVVARLGGGVEPPCSHVVTHPVFLAVDWTTLGVGSVVSGWDELFGN
jgi:hypothetical protein